MSSHKTTRHYNVQWMQCNVGNMSIAQFSLLSPFYIFLLPPVTVFISLSLAGISWQKKDEKLHLLLLNGADDIQLINKYELWHLVAYFQYSQYHLAQSPGLNWISTFIFGLQWSVLCLCIVVWVILSWEPALGQKTGIVGANKILLETHGPSDSCKLNSLE